MRDFSDPGQSAMADKAVLLRCRQCNTVNRVPVARLGAQPKCGKCKAALDFPREAIELTDLNFNREVLENPGVVLIFFWAPWCAHCRAMIPAVQELARQRAGEVKVGMVNTEKETSMARRFDVMSVPRLILYRYGKKLDELNGAVQKPQLDAWTEYTLRTH